MRNQTLSVVLATFNEESNISDCLKSVQGVADEIVIVDGSSHDKTREIAESFGAKVLITDNPPMFHINKQKALEAAQYKWILQLDADERVSPELGDEIRKVITMSNEEIEDYQNFLPNRTLFLRHQNLLEQRDGNIGLQNSEYAAFFMPRLNYFLGKYLRYGGVYPDGVIRLMKNGKAHFPCKDVHEQIKIEGKVGWLQYPLFHYDSPTFERYLKRNSRYITLMANDLEEKEMKQNSISMLQYMMILPITWFVLSFGRHKGFLDGWRGFIFSFFSAMRFPRAYIRYLKNKN